MTNLSKTFAVAGLAVAAALTAGCAASPHRQAQQQARGDLSPKDDARLVGAGLGGIAAALITKNPLVILGGAAAGAGGGGLLSDKFGDNCTQETVTVITRPIVNGKVSEAEGTQTTTKRCVETTREKGNSVNVPNPTIAK